MCKRERVMTPWDKPERCACAEKFFPLLFIQHREGVHVPRDSGTTKEGGGHPTYDRGTNVRFFEPRDEIV